MCVKVYDMCPLCEVETGAMRLYDCSDARTEAGCKQLDIRKEFPLRESLPFIDCKTEDCYFNRESIFKSEDSWRATLEANVDEKSVNEAASVPEPTGIEQDHTPVTDASNTNFTPVTKPVVQASTYPVVNTGTRFTPINQPTPANVPVKSVPSGSAGENKTKRKAADDGASNAKRVATGDKPSLIVTLPLPESAAQIFGIAPANTPASVVAAPPPAVIAPSPAVVASAAPKGTANSVEPAGAKPSSPPVSTQAVRTITTKKIKIEYRSAGRVALEDLDGDVVEEIKSLQAKMHERIEEQRQSQKRTISWLLEEDNLLQKLRLHGFAFTQISREYLTRRSVPSCTLRRLKQKTKHTKGFVHIPNGPEEEEVEVEEWIIPETSAAGAAKGNAGESSAETQTVQTHADPHNTLGAQLEQGSVGGSPQSQPQHQGAQSSGASAESSIAGPSRRLPRIVVKSRTGSSIARSQAQAQPRPQAEPTIGVSPSPPAARLSTASGSDDKEKGKAAPMPVTINDDVEPSTSVGATKPKPKAKCKNTTRKGKGKAIPNDNLVEDDESDCSDSDIQALPCVPRCNGPVHFCRNYVR